MRELEGGGIMMNTVREVDGKEQIIQEYIPLVKYIASRIMFGKNKYMEYEDLVSYGMIGLIDALNKYDGEEEDSVTPEQEIEIKETTTKKEVTTKSEEVTTNAQ